MSKNQFFQNDVAKNLICDDKKKLASGRRKNNFHFVTIKFFIFFLKKDLGIFSVAYL